MKRLKDRIERTSADKPCADCVNTFRDCPMEIVLSFTRVPAGMEVAVLECPERKEK